MSPLYELEAFKKYFDDPFKISDLIEILITIKGKYGDLPLYFESDESHDELLITKTSVCEKDELDYPRRVLLGQNVTL
jgi:hypothetical protein